MKDVKTKERIGNAFEAFFGKGENNSDFLEKTSADETSKEPTNKIKAKDIFKVLKQILLFLPGTFVTFFLWMDIVAIGRMPRFSLFFMLVLLLPPFLMVAGMGNIKKIKHWLMPLNVIILGSFLGFVLSSIPVLKSLFTGNGKITILFPLALITAVLSKNWVEKFKEDSSL